MGSRYTEVELKKMQRWQIADLMTELGSYLKKAPNKDNTIKLSDFFPPRNLRFGPWDGDGQVAFWCPKN